MADLMSNEEYWRKRSLEDKKRSINLTEKFINSELKRNYKDALTEVQVALERLYQAFADANDIGLSEAKRMLQGNGLNAAELDALREMLKQNRKSFAEKRGKLPDDVVAAMEKRHKAMEEQLKRLSQKGRMTHLELSEMQIQNALLHLTDQKQITIYDVLENQYRDGYFRNVFEVQSGIGFGVDFTAPDEKAVRRAVMKSWSKNNFSDLIWGQEKQLAKELREALTTGLIRGDSIDQMTKRLTGRMEVSQSNARRLVRTETAHIHEQAALDAYTECGIDYYEFLATLDRRTSEKCREMDGKVCPIKDAKVGENYPPLHPNCRSTTVPAQPTDQKSGLSRAARSADGKYYTVPADMTYKDWYAGLSEDERGRMRLEDKKDRNRKKDAERVKNIRSQIGRMNTPTVEKYQDMKYNGTEEYRLLMGYKRAVSDGSISALTGIDQYKQTAEAVRELMGLETTSGTKISGFATHFVDRIIGQQAADEPGRPNVRTGVHIEDVRKTLEEASAEPIKVNHKGERSQQYIGETCTVTVNPDTGILIQTQPRKVK